MSLVVRNATAKPFFRYAIPPCRLHSANRVHATHFLHILGDIHAKHPDDNAKYHAQVRMLWKPYPALIHIPAYTSIRVGWRDRGVTDCHSSLRPVLVSCVPGDRKSARVRCRRFIRRVHSEFHTLKRFFCPDGCQQSQCLAGAGPRFDIS